jgi:hypothetical protein
LSSRQTKPIPVAPNEASGRLGKAPNEAIDKMDKAPNEANPAFLAPNEASGKRGKAPNEAIEPGPAPNEASGKIGKMPLHESTGPVGSPADIQEHMDVYASCGTKVGKVDHVEGKFIKLTKNNSLDGQHNRIPLSWVAKVHDHVHLNKDHVEVRDQWQPAGS